MRYRTLGLVIAVSILLINSTLQAQDTFSIVAIDSATGEVGSAGASCVNMAFFPGYENDFLGQLFPGQGAINSQAYYLPDNQANAALRMEAGDTPSEIIRWLVANDVEGNPDIRQYGVVGFVDGEPQSSAHTGMLTDDYKGHRLGPNYSIQGNILLGPEILDSMEARFLAAEGDLACKLMAAMQGANVVGADTRCAGFGTSSLFAFLKVAQPTDEPGSPSFVISMNGTGPQGIEPIDSLQVLFDEQRSCGTGTGIDKSPQNNINIYPIPSVDYLMVENNAAENLSFDIIDLHGRICYSGIATKGTLRVNTASLTNGVYIFSTKGHKISFVKTE